MNVRHYCATAHLPTTRRIPLHNQHPCLEGLFSADTAQPRRHDVVVNVIHGQKTNQFHIFFRERGRSPLNDSLRDSQSRRAWAHRSYGDVIVLRRGQRKAYINIRAADRKMENAAVKRCVSHILARLSCPLTFLTASSDTSNSMGFAAFLDISTAGCVNDLFVVTCPFCSFYILLLRSPSCCLIESSSSFAQLPVCYSRLYLCIYNIIHNLNLHTVEACAPT